MRQLKKAALVLTVILFGSILVGAIRYINGEEDYYPEPGSLKFYLKLSSVIRNVPLILPAEAPTYFGTIGDGSKLPQSAVTYLTLEKDEKVLVSSVTRYLQQERFFLDETEQTPVVESDHKEMVHWASYINVDNESVWFRVVRLRDKGTLEIKVTHFE